MICKTILLKQPCQLACNLFGLYINELSNVDKGGSLSMPFANIACMKVNTRKIKPTKCLMHNCHRLLFFKNQSSAPVYTCLAICLQGVYTKRATILFSFIFFPQKYYFALVSKPSTKKFNSNPQWDQYIQRKGVTILLVRDIKTLSSNGDMQPLAHQTKCTHILFQEVESSIKPVITSHKPTLVCTSQYIGMLVDIDYCLDCSYW